MSVYIITFLYTDDYNDMSLVVEKLSSINFDKYQEKILQSLKEEYKKTYNLDIDDNQRKTLIDYCLSYMYVLVSIKTSTKQPIEKSKVLGYFSLSRMDLNKSLNVINFLFNYVLGNVYIFDVYVFPKYRNRGIGSYLVRKAVQKAKEDFKINSIYLYIKTINLKTFYERSGFSYKKDINIDGNKLLLFEKKTMKLI